MLPYVKCKLMLTDVKCKLILTDVRCKLILTYVKCKPLSFQNVKTKPPPKRDQKATKAQRICYSV